MVQCPFFRNPDRTTNVTKRTNCAVLRHMRHGLGRGWTEAVPPSKRDT